MRKFRKKGFAWLLAALMLLTVFPATGFAGSGRIVLEPLGENTFQLVAAEYYGLKNFDFNLTAEGIRFTSFDNGADAAQAGLAGNRFDFVGNPSNGRASGFFEDALWTAEAFRSAAEERGKTLSDSFDPARFVLGIVTYEPTGAPGETATVSLSGTVATTEGNEDAAASLEIVLSEAEAPSLQGDVTGDGMVGAMDARFVQRAAVKLEVATEAQRAIMDIDENGKIESADARLIWRGAVKHEDFGPTVCEQIKNTEIENADPDRTIGLEPGDSRVSLFAENLIGMQGFDLVLETEGVTLAKYSRSKDERFTIDVNNPLTCEMNVKDGFFAGYFTENNWDRDTYEEKANNLGEEISADFDPQHLSLGTVKYDAIAGFSGTPSLTVRGYVYVEGEGALPVCQTLTLPKSETPAEPGYIGLEQIDGAHVAVRAFDLIGLLNFDLQLIPDEGISFGYPDLNPDAEQAALARNDCTVEFNPERDVLSGYFKEELWDTATFRQAASDRGKTLSDDFDASRFALAILPVSFTGVKEGTVRLIGNFRTAEGSQNVDTSLKVSVSPTEPTEPTENPHKPSLGKSPAYMMTASTEGDIATVYVYFQNMVGFTAADLTFTYDPDVLTLTDLVKGADAALVKRVPGNSFDVEYNDQKGSVFVGVMFRDRLYSTADFADNGVSIDGENFEALVMTFKINRAVGFTSVFGVDRKGTYPGCDVQISTGEPPHVHAFGDWSVARAATCIEKGEEIRTCDCGEKETRELAALGHQPQKAPGTQPTCAAAGKEGDTVCARCGAMLETGAVIPALPHTWDAGKVTTEPTAEKEGVRTFTCTVCRGEKTEPVEKLIKADNARENKEEVFAKNEQKTEDVLKNAGAGAKIVTKDGKELETGKLVGSGMKIVKADGTEKVIVVKGDNDGDGKVTASDARTALRMAVNLPTDNAGAAWEKEASLVNDGKTLSAADARLILRGAVGLEKPVDWFNKAA